MDNHRYEHLGDTVLGMLITDMLSTMYPGLRVGPSTVRFSFSFLCLLLTD